MNDRDASNPARPLLHYAKPNDRRGRPVFAVILAILAVCSGSFGATMLFYGVPGIIWVFTEDNDLDFRGDLFSASMFLLIGLVCLVVAIRWCAAVRGIFSGARR